jgi:hypothetical protein
MDVHQDDDDTISTKDEFLLTTNDHDDKSTGAMTTAERQIQDMMIEYNHRVNLIIPAKSSQSNRRIGKNFVSFTDKIYLILKIAPKYEFDVYISWAIHGRCFYIHNREMFLQTIGTQ